MVPRRQQEVKVQRSVNDLRDRSQGQSVPERHKLGGSGRRRSAQTQERRVPALQVSLHAEHKPQTPHHRFL